MAQWSKRNLGHLELAAGDPAAAERVLRDSWDVLVEMGLNSSLGETAVPLAEALHAQGRDEEANETLKAVKDEWASGDASIAAPRLAVRARLQAADGLDERRAPDRGARRCGSCGAPTCCASRRTRCSRTPRWPGWPASTTRRPRAPRRR